MPTLAERITAQLATLADERARLAASYTEQVAALDEQEAALRGASKLLSRELEGAYVALLKLKLIKEV
jgi:hypothetical protein